MRLHKAKHTSIIPTSEGDIEFRGGAVYRENVVRRYYPEDKKLQRSFDYIGDGPPDPPDWTSATKLELAEYVRLLRDWITGPVGRQLDWCWGTGSMPDAGPSEVTMSEMVMRLIDELVGVAVRHDRVERPDTNGLDETGALVVLNGIVEWAESANATRASKKKPGRRSNKERDKRIAEQYHKGLEAGEWGGQADYLRKMHPERWGKSNNSAKAWLSTVLKRAEGYQNS